CSAGGLGLALAEPTDDAQVAFCRTPQSSFRIAADNKLGPCAVQFRECVRLELADDVADGCAIHRDQIGIAIHKTDKPSVWADLRHVARQQRTGSLFPGSPMQHLKSSEMAAHADESKVVIQPVCLALPEDDCRIGILHPLTLRLVQINRNAAERAA